MYNERRTMDYRRNVITLVFNSRVEAEQFCASKVFDGFRDIEPEIEESNVYVHHKGGIDFLLWFKRISDKVMRLPTMPCDTYRYETVA